MFVTMPAVSGDYILNGRGFGPAAEMLGAVHFDAGFLRPYYDKYGKPSVTINTGRTTLVKGRQVPIREHRYIKDLLNNGMMSPVFNATSLRKEEWIMLDQTVIKAARYRLRAWSDLSSRSSYGGFNGMSKMILEHETMSDPGEALVDMDGLAEGRTDSPTFQLEGLPLPITHSDFWFSARRLAVSRNSGTPLDTTMGEAAGRRIGEKLEKTLIGVNTGITYGGNSTQVGGYSRNSTVYGYLNFPNRITYTGLTTPTGSNPEATLANVLHLVDLLKLNKFYGPWMLYTSNDWDQYLDNDYMRLASANNSIGGSMTLRERLKKIEGIEDVRRLDFLFSSLTDPVTGAPLSDRGPGLEDIITANPFTMLLVQMTSEVARAVNGMDITTVQWPSMGGMRLNFKVMCIQVPQLRCDKYGNCGILQATAA